MFHFTVETNQSVDEAIQSLQEELQKEKFGVLWDFDIKETLNKKGFDFQDTYRVLEVCNPKAASEVLSLQPLVSYFLPCKIVVYEDQGTTKIGMPKPTVFMEHIEDTKLIRIAEDIENRLIAAINAAK
ncbi:uncharacterized protein (DUF302 family) [Melghiribacillus thermohalophilus]|uniref:Uncharacterized protein (DUF302 family) n=1 Tax=Melghiribacillus thermohalophilus TaxID=1324956 RepID=A0A4V2V0F9_9BACI|nr:DUF302 domain-containing protein [Melghiribacillus thermohalophilus]TCT15967.1 uncharacterized protein (DUF302 family) [Melghiribacillus thermohalophilus]